jgi:EpsI family protein
MNNKTFIAVLAILVLVAAFSIVSYLPTKFDDSAAVRISDFPKVVGEWTAQDVPLDKRIYELLETDNLIMRDYKNNAGYVINLYVIYSQSNRKVSHPPEICLQGDGGTIVDKRYVRISPKIVAAKLVLEQKDFQQAVLYWYKTGKSFTHDFLNQQINVSLDRMLGKTSSVALIRVITRIGTDSKDSAFQMLSSFSRQIEPLLLKYAP